ASGRVPLTGDECDVTGADGILIDTIQATNRRTCDEFTKSRLFSRSTILRRPAAAADANIQVLLQHRDRRHPCSFADRYGPSRTQRWRTGHTARSAACARWI